MSGRTSLRVVAVGDLSFNGRWEPLRRRHGSGHFLGRVAASWAGADLCLANLESPLTDAPRSHPAKLVLRGAPAAAGLLRDVGFACVALANNHAMDFGPAGLEQTLARLRTAGVPAVGAGADATAAHAPVVLHRRGQSVGLLAFCDVVQRSPLYAGDHTPGVAAFDPIAAAQAVRDLRPAVDWLIVHVHWGHELCQLPSPAQRAAARELVGAGADLVLGHHPHVVQPMERVSGVPVFYSLGNFLFSDMYWRGRYPGGAPFVSKFRLPPLSRRNGWADVTLRADEPAEVQFHPARLGRDLAVRPDATPRRHAEWQRLCRLLDEPSYEAAYEAERRRANRRLAWQTAWRSPLRRLELLLFRWKLLPHAVEGC